MAERHLVWDGCFNVRDLGGHETVDGRTTRFGAVVRSDAPDRLSEAGWQALQSHGVRTIVDLRDPSELGGEARGAEIASVHVPVLDFEDRAFWEEMRGIWDTVRFYRGVLAHWPERFTRAVVEVARADPGAVLVHCQVGRDRTGLVSAMLLSLAGVPVESIAADYALSADRLRPLYEELLRDAPDESVRARLQRENVSSVEAMLEVLRGFDVEDYLRRGGATDDDLAAARARLL